jgi:hypothetical protein
LEELPPKLPKLHADDYDDFQLDGLPNDNKHIDNEIACD